MATLRPFHDNVIVELEEQGQTASGLTLVGNKNGVRKGVVVAVGPGLYTPEGAVVPCSAKTGERVLLPPNGGTEMTDVLNPGEPKRILIRDVQILSAIDD